MTYQEILESDKDVLTPQDVCKVLRCDSYAISLTAYSKPETLGFPVCVLQGTKQRTVKIPRRAFINWMEGKMSES